MLMAAVTKPLNAIFAFHHHVNMQVPKQGHISEASYAWKAAGQTATHRPGPISRRPCSRLERERERDRCIIKIG